MLTIIRVLFLSSGLLAGFYSMGQQKVELKRNSSQKKIDVVIGGRLFTSFLFPDTIEKPVLYPVLTSKGTEVTRGFPLNPKPGDPTDHPHHIGIWMNFENVNGLDFWNNSSAIPTEKKEAYGWIKTNPDIKTTSGKKGSLEYSANWTNQKNNLLLVENTSLEFSGNKDYRIIDRTTELKAIELVKFTDAKDGFFGIRLAHELEIPAAEDKEFKDDKGNLTIVKASTGLKPNGNYLTSEGIKGDSVWSTRAKWCMVFGKMGKDSVSVAIIDHPENINYPTYWHARGYGLFAANPLGEKIFTNGLSAKNLELKPGEKVSFRYRVVVYTGARVIPGTELDQIAASYANTK